MILNKISYISTKIEQSLRLGTPCCNNEALILLLLNSANLKCLNKTELVKYNDIVKTLTYDCNILTPKVIITSNNKEQWEENNPECISRKQWEKIAYKICNKYKIEISIEKINTVCDIAFEITKNIIDCDILPIISLQQKLCDLNIIFEKNTAQCKIDYLLLLEKYPTCNMSLNNYKTLNNSGYSFEMITSLYNKNVELEVDENNNIILTTPINKYILPHDIQFNGVIATSSQNVRELGTLLDSYNINEKIKKQIINEISII